MMFRPGCYEKGGLGEIVLGRDCLHRGVGQELLEYDDCCRVSREPLRREGVELKDGRTHGGTLRSHAWTRDGDYANEHAALPREQVSVFAGARVVVQLVGVLTRLVTGDEELPLTRPRDRGPVAVVDVVAHLRLGCFGPCY